MHGHCNTGIKKTKRTCKASWKRSCRHIPSKSWLQMEFKLSMLMTKHKLTETLKQDKRLQNYVGKNKKGNNDRDIPSSAWKLYQPQTSQDEWLHKSSINAAYFHGWHPAFQSYFYLFHEKGWNWVRYIHFYLVYGSHQFCSQIINYFFCSCISKHKVLLQLPKFSKPQLPNNSVDFSSNLDEYNHFSLKTCSSVLC